MPLLIAALPLAAALAHAPSFETLPAERVRSEASQAATSSGRVKRIDRRREEVVIETGGHDEVFGVADARILDVLREGDRVRFEYEDREGGRKVIVRVF